MHTHSLSSFSLITFSLYTDTHLGFSLCKISGQFPLPYADFSAFALFFLRCSAYILPQLSVDVTDDVCGC